MPRSGRLWIAIDVDLLDISGNRHGIDDAAILAYLRLLAWAKRHRTDGKIPFSVAPLILKGTASDLEAAGLIAVDDDDHVIVLDWHKWHESADELEKRRAADRERKRAARAREAMPLSLSTKYLEKSRESGVTPGGVRPDTPVDNSAWSAECPHGAPHNGRGCFECRTGRDLG